jgi:accessory colonization factor AcfC
MLAHFRFSYKPLHANKRNNSAKRVSVKNNKESEYVVVQKNPKKLKNFEDVSYREYLIRIIVCALQNMI